MSTDSAEFVTRRHQPRRLRRAFESARGEQHDLSCRSIHLPARAGTSGNSAALSAGISALQRLRMVTLAGDAPRAARGVYAHDRRSCVRSLCLPGRFSHQSHHEPHHADLRNAPLLQSCVRAGHRRRRLHRDPAPAAALQPRGRGFLLDRLVPLRRFGPREHDHDNLPLRYGQLVSCAAVRLGRRAHGAAGRQRFRRARGHSLAAALGRLA